ncbi:MAG TPA: (deoxy)nucleoside triphosphate pyrophosphohydrolase [Acidobacteriaceae bacterium]|nr:(deoxy)nucleoside triphosphate pyrophosphohydrolase [Acidobacteriaceae bacterium]
MKEPIRKLDHRRPQAAAKPLRHVVAALMLRTSGETREVLICQRRADQPMGLKWEFPGGKIEPDETSVEALARELDEELAIRATIGPRITTIRHTYRNGGAIEIEFFLVRDFQGEPVNRIFEQMLWSPFSRLPDYDFLSADLNLIRDLADGKLL